MVHFARHWTDPFAGSLQIVDRCILSLCDRIPARHRAVRSLKMRAFEHRSFRSLPDAARSRRYSKREPEPATRHASDVSTAVGIGWRVAAWAALARACASGAGAAWPFSTSAIELKDNKRPRAPPRNQRTPAVSEQVMVPVTSSCQLSVGLLSTRSQRTCAEPVPPLATVRDVPNCLGAPTRLRTCGAR